MMFEALRRQLAGVVAITVTPFTADDRVDEAALAAITCRMVEAGISVVTPNGNTGEYYSLSAAERSTCLRVVKEAAGDAILLAGVGGPLPSAIEAALEARDAGADAVMIHHPVQPYITADGWIEYHRAIAAAVPELGVVPYLKSRSITADALRSLASAAPNFVGIKYALPDPVDFASIRSDANIPGLVWIAGLAESYAASQFAATAEGFTSGLANVVPEVSLNYLQALKRGDFSGALEQWQDIRDFEDLRARDNNALNVSAVKEALHQIGLCDRAVRAPISTLEPADRERVSRMLASWNVDLASASALG
ncbi:dihydrodipicolinate synthase family protein [Zafaria cholistanensis]|uniref:Dihydrodipicolinate synthase family protein n=1 Tax=Zafaria cholistanensis TaxID=1682741 RepID=A0A5A7NU48_9MICC|nr:dihydrodipicolinate synthase family protein [Zafaria cholistanensis]GER23291.1 dihydrodipicolinate synthase family protein [Zafaria cholistanensis]